MPYFKQLCHALRQNNYQACQAILAQSKSDPHANFDINGFNSKGYAPIHLAACTANNAKIITLLLENGADPNLLTSHGFSPLDLCVKHERFRDQPNAITFLQYFILNAIKKRKPEDLEKYLAYAMKHVPEFNINEKIAGRTLLDYAIKTQNPALCRLLVNAGCDINLPSRIGSKDVTPIRRIINLVERHYSRSQISYGFKSPLAEIISILVNGAPNRQGADLKETAEVGNTKISLLTRLVKAYRFSDLNITRSDIVQNWQVVKNMVLNGHRFDLKEVFDISGYHLDLEGINAGITTMELLESYHEFISSPEVRKELNALMNMSLRSDHVDYYQMRQDGNVDMATQIAIDIRGTIEPINMNTVMTNLEYDQITAIPLNTSVNEPGDHAQSCLIDGNHFIHINCGATRDPRGPQGITVYEIGDQKAFLELVPLLINSPKNPLDDAFLTNELVKKGALKEVYNIKVPLQTVGNCAWKSSEALIRAITFMNIFKRIRSQVIDAGGEEMLAFKSAEVDSQKWQDLFINYDRSRGLKQCEGFKTNILKNVYAGMEQKTQAEKKKNVEAQKYWLLMQNWETIHNMHKGMHKKESSFPVDRGVKADRKESNESRESRELKISKETPNTKRH